MVQVSNKRYRPVRFASLPMRNHQIKNFLGVVQEDEYAWERKSDDTHDDPNDSGRPRLRGRPGKSGRLELLINMK
jgi:hypothetical protein